MQLLSFDNLAQRLLYRYAFTFADFVPVGSDKVTVEAQRAFYDLLGSIVCGIANDPATLGLSTAHPDEWLSAHDVMNRHPEMYKVRNDCQKAFNDLSGMLFTAGLCGEVRGGRLAVNRGDLPKLTAKTLGTYKKLLEGYGLLMEIGEEALSFDFPACPEALAAWGCSRLSAANLRTTNVTRECGSHSGCTVTTGRISWSAYGRCSGWTTRSSGMSPKYIALKGTENSSFSMNTVQVTNTTKMSEGL